MRRGLCTLLVLTLIGGVAAHSHAARSASAPARPHAVVALFDTGINPYHRVFRDRTPQAMQHPSSYLPGYPKHAIALRITLDAEDYYDAVVKDCKAIWATVRPGRLYWFPGTKIVGAISFADDWPDIDCDAARPDDTWILSTGHGSMTASRAASTEYGACRECRVVAIQQPNGAGPGADTSVRDFFIAGISWAADNAAWIDAQSNSWGPIAPAWEPTGFSGIFAADPGLTRAVEATARRHLAFWASGNGAAFRGGVLGHPTLAAPHLGPSAIVVGGHDSGYVTTWPGSTPDIASDACSSWAMDGASTEDSRENNGGGTSAAAPYAAGGAARILLEARRILGDVRTGVRGDVVAQGRRGIVRSGPLADGRFTLAEWRDVLFHTATARPVGEHDDGPACGAFDAPYHATPVRWADVPDSAARYYQLGYGAIDSPAKALAYRVLRGQMPMPIRPDDDQHYRDEQSVRQATFQLFSQP